MRSEHGGQVAAALLLDAVLGEPPEAVHPTVLMGRAISAFEQRALKMQSPRSRRLAGIFLALAMPSLIFFSTRKVLERFAWQAPVDDRDGLDLHRALDARPRGSRRKRRARAERR